MISKILLTGVVNKTQGLGDPYLVHTGIEPERRHNERIRDARSDDFLNDHTFRVLEGYLVVALERTKFFEDRLLHKVGQRDKEIFPNNGSSEFGSVEPVPKFDGGLNVGAGGVFPQPVTRRRQPCVGGQ